MEQTPTERDSTMIPKDYAGEIMGFVRARVKVDESGCWVWQRTRGHRGYGQMMWRGMKSTAHRMVYRCTRGEVPEGWDVCHTCDNPPCCAPLHLFAAPRHVNVQDMRAKGRGNNQRKTACKRGHEYTPENTYTDPRGFRQCKKCNQVRQRMLQGWTREQAETLPKVPHGYSVKQNRLPPSEGAAP